MRELKVELSSCVARGRQSEVIDDTSHGTPIARSVGMPGTDPPGVARFLRTGQAIRRGDTPAPGNALTVAKGAASTNGIVQQDRA